MSLVLNDLLSIPFRKRWPGLLALHSGRGGIRIGLSDCNLLFLHFIERFVRFDGITLLGGFVAGRFGKSETLIEGTEGGDEREADNDAPNYRLIHEHRSYE
jgi:hypothetical protein